MLFKKISFLIGVVLVSSVYAADYPKPIQTAVNAGLKVITDFPTPAGLHGWVMQQGNQYSIVYTTADEQYLVTGVLVDSNGKNLSAEYGQKFIPKPDYSAPYDELANAAWFSEGSKNDSNMIYVFFDANCIFCHLVWKALQPYEKAGLQVRWIPVAFLKKDSAGKAAALLAAKNPAASMAVNMGKFDKKDESGGIPAAGKIPAETLKRIQQNGALMERFGSNGTPTLVWKDKSGQISALGGMPRLSDLPDMTGLAEQQIDDPELARFK
ncbi:MAG: thiol:disulfide interchange protein DsbG [Pseudomonadota bacterium]